MKKRAKRSRFFTITIILVLVLVFGAQLYIIWGLTVPLRAQQEEDLQTIAELEQKIAELEYMLANTDDPEVIRRVAEEILGLVSQNEIKISGNTVGGG